MKIEKAQIVDDLGPLVQEFCHNWTYRFLAAGITLPIIAFALIMAAFSDFSSAFVGVALLLAGFLIMFWRQQASERLLLFERGICLARGSRRAAVLWTFATTMEIDRSSNEVVIRSHDRRRLVFRLNWRPLPELLEVLYQVQDGLSEGEG